jgi:hypothetical protein
VTSLTRVVPVEEIKPGTLIRLPSGRQFPVVDVEVYEADGPSAGGYVVVYDTGRMSRGKPEEGFAPERIVRQLAIRPAGAPVEIA